MRDRLWILGAVLLALAWIVVVRAIPVPLLPVDQATLIRTGGLPWWATPGLARLPLLAFGVAMAFALAATMRTTGASAAAERRLRKAR
jgi:hypothetical protein